MKQVHPVIFTQLGDKKNTVLIEVPDLEILTEGYGMANAMEMARDAIGRKVISMEDRNKKIPDPRSLKEIDVAQGTFAQEGEGCVSMFRGYCRKLL